MTDEKYRGSGSDPLSKRILNSIKPFSGEHTSKWLAALSTDTVKDSVVISGGAENAQEPPRSMAAWVDNLFDHFQRYAFDFSRMCTDSDLQVNCTRPTVQDSKGGTSDTSIVSTGYLSTTQWALVVRGEFFRIQVYVLPVGMLMGFRARHEEFPLYMEMLATQAARNKIKWALDGQPVSMDQAPSIAKKLFAHLVMVARGEAKETDKFSLNLPPAKSEFPTGPGLPQRPSSFDQDLGLLKPEWLVEERPNPQRAGTQGNSSQFDRGAQNPLAGGTTHPSQFASDKPASQFDTGSHFPGPQQTSDGGTQPGGRASANVPPQTPAERGVAQYPSAPQVSPVAPRSNAVPQAPVAQQQQYPSAALNAPLNAPTQSNVQQSVQPAAQATPSPSPTAQEKQLSMQDMLQQNLVLVLNECNHFAGALDEQLEMLTPIGVKAIQNQDMSTASEIMQRAKKLKALLDAVVTFRNEYKDSGRKAE